ncbi:MAG: DUF898 family protein [Rhodospirillaceae bacterium]|jgi:uncharacterized membrane protein YjgN (DUF898 family)|nr:DUF898 family protein [Rhodospirillaceae bacterium]MBT6118403.1 DUF898 family protein [Rhodospirillaceae bacterium]
MSDESVVQPERQVRWDGTTVAPGDVVAFDGRRAPLFRLVLKNIVLTILTVGIYRFWAKTAVRRWFWRLISIAEERLEYTGKASELLVGFLIAMCILLPFFAVTSILEQMASTSVAGTIAAQVVYFLGLFLLIQAAIFRMRRYRLTRTMWRGIRCGLDGRTLDYVKAGVGYWLLVIVTLGFAYPWMRAGLSRHLMTRTRFGAQNFGFEVTARALLVHWAPVAWVWLGILGCIAIGWASGDPYPQGPINEIAGFTGLAMILLLVAQIPLYVRYRVREFRIFAAGTSLGEVGFESDLRVSQIIWLYLGAGLLLLLVIGFLAILAGGFLVGPMGSSPAGPEAGLAFLPVFFVVLIGLVVAMPIINLVIIQFGLARAVAGSVKIRNLPAVESIIQSTEATPGHGEGLADALDLGDF